MTDLAGTAIHEAGHCVAAYVAGVLAADCEASIVAGPWWTGYYRPGTLPPLGDLLGAETTMQLENDLYIFLAGPFAQEIYGRHCPSAARELESATTAAQPGQWESGPGAAKMGADPAPDDLEAARRVANVLAGGDDDLEDLLLRQAEVQAAFILDLHRPALFAVAKLLLERGVVAGEELLAACAMPPLETTSGVGISLALLGCTLRRQYRRRLRYPRPPALRLHAAACVGA